jgi:outer membrane protein TolC
MKPPTTNWIAHMRWGVRAPALLSLCMLIAGCHSIPLASMIADQDKSMRASFGKPSIAQDATAMPAPNEQIIDFATALQRAGVENPTIAIADEAVRASLAEQMQARALLFPTLDVGTNFRMHQGTFMSGAGVITQTNLQSLYYGFGADAKGSGTVAVPGLRLVCHLADAYYAPQAAQQKVVQSRFDATATRHYILMEVGIRYLALVEAHAQAAAFRQSLIDFDEIERLTTNFAEKGQGREADAQRARSETLLLRADAQRAEEAIGVAAAELARLIDLDPAQRLRPVDVVPPLFEFVPKNVSVPALLDQAMRDHPEIVARSADIAYQEIRLRQERVRPFLPLIAVGFSAGEFSGGATNTTSRVGQFSPRTDLDIVAVWSLQNLGHGNRAVQNIARSGLGSAQIEYARLLDRIRREVVEAHARTEALRQDVALARKRVETSQRAYTQDMTRAINNQGRPLEVLNSANQLNTARQDLVRAMIAYSQAQLQLYTALGNPPSRLGTE